MAIADISGTGAQSATMNNFSNFLRHSRTATGLTQKDVSERTGIAQPTYSQWERGERLPSRQASSSRSLLELAKVLACNHEDLIDLLVEARKGRRSARTTAQPLNARAFLKMQQEEILPDLRNGLVGDQSIDIWLLTTGKVPLLENDQLVRIWTENLPNRINYKIIWFLDILSSNHFWPSVNSMTKALDKLKGLGEGAVTGRVIHYPVKAFEHGNGGSSDTHPLSNMGNDYRENLRLFESFRDRKPNASIFREVQSLPTASRQQLLSYVSKVGTLAVYSPADGVGETAKSIRSVAILPVAAFGVQEPSAVWFSIRPDEEAREILAALAEVDEQILQKQTASER